MVGESALWCRYDLERVVVLLELDAVAIEERLLAEQHWDIGIDKDSGHGDRLDVVLNPDHDLGDKALGRLHRDAHHRARATGSAIDAQRVGDGGGHRDLVGARVDESRKFAAWSAARDQRRSKALTLLKRKLPPPPERYAMPCPRSRSWQSAVHRSRRPPVHPAYEIKQAPKHQIIQSRLL